MMMVIVKVINTTERKRWRRWPLHRVVERELDVLQLLQTEPFAVYRHPKIAQVYRVLSTSHVFLEHDPAVMYTTVIARRPQFQTGQGFLPHRRRFLRSHCPTIDLEDYAISSDSRSLAQAQLPTIRIDFRFCRRWSWAARVLLGIYTRISNTLLCRFRSDEFVVDIGWTIRVNSFLHISSLACTLFLPRYNRDLLYTLCIRVFSSSRCIDQLMNNCVAMMSHQMLV